MFLNANVTHAYGRKLGLLEAHKIRPESPYYLLDLLLSGRVIKPSHVPWKHLVSEAAIIHKSSAHN
jgi:hypothetical protein